MRPALFVCAAFLALTTGCGAGAVDYSSLHHAAEARQRAAGTHVVPPSSSARALLSRPLTAESAAQIALLNNRRVRATLERLNGRPLSMAQRLPNPSLEGAVRFGEGDPEIELGALIDVTHLLFLPLQISAADVDARAAQLESVGALIDLSFDARRSFYEYQAAAEVLELRRTVVATLAAAADAATRLRRAGNITELDRANEQSALEEARLGLQRAEVTLASARERLNAVLGVWGEDARWQAAPRLPELPDPELATRDFERRALTRSLDLAGAKLRFAAAARRANIARISGLLPELKAGVSAERHGEWAVGPAVELELPLFYAGQGEIDAARSEMRGHEHTYADAAVRVRAAARDVAVRVEAARAAVMYFRSSLLPLKQRIVEETQLQYNAMAVGLFQLLQARREQIQTATGYVETLHAYWQARLDAEQLLAGRLVPIGRAVNEPAFQAPSSVSAAH